ncbi:MAG TPA: hypothetical protein VK821_05315 [Dehalococcoidia bacterium]|nr:hypothetical protein [Dehalococcoidia bacterium]
MTTADDERILAGVRAHLDALGAVQDPPPIDYIRARTSSRQALGTLEITLATIVVLVVAILGAGAVGRFLPAAGGPASGSASQGDFTLELRADSAKISAGQPIQGLTATLTYKGSQASAEIWHGHGLPIGFGVVEPISGITLAPGSLQSCEHSTLTRNVGLTAPFAKSSFSLKESEAFNTFMADPALRLPPGTWHIYAFADFWAGPCSSTHYEIRVAITVQAS